MTAKSGDSFVRRVTVLVGRRLYTVEVGSFKQERLNAEDVTKFFESFAVKDSMESVRRSESPIGMESIMIEGHPDPKTSKRRHPILFSLLGGMRTTSSAVIVPLSALIRIGRGRSHCQR